nr:phosphoribosylformylglycinamidine cyclo-ligase-like [Nerophis lumbriciformis]
MGKTESGSAYAEAGVDLEAQDQALGRVKGMLRSTYTDGVLSDLGSFGGLFRPNLSGFAEPVLVASADGVGTKLMVARRVGDYSTVGRDLVNHCVNDILVQGARPLFFLDYVAGEKLEPDAVVQLVEGVAAACRENGCALLGGETAEMPGFYQPGDYELVGFVVGLVDRQRLLDGSRVRPGDVLVGLPSSGLHTNGYSLARRVFFERLGLEAGDRVPGIDSDESVGRLLLAPHLSYLKSIEPLLDHSGLHALAHITGGGLTDNLPRVFTALQEHGAVGDEEMLRVFNMGIGMVLVVDSAALAEILASLREAGRRLRSDLRHSRPHIDAGNSRPVSDRVRIAVLLSGRGSNFLALHEAIEHGELPATIALVVSNRSAAPGLARARQLGLPAVALPQKDFASRDQHEARMLDEIRRAGAEWVCLAGYMRLLTPRFVSAFPQRILNIHPSLLPAFPGLDAQQQALEHGVRLSGCTVHLVDEGLDSGPIVVQRAVALEEQDGVETLAQRILTEEHRAYPEALCRLLTEEWKIEGRRIRFRQTPSKD